VVFEQEMAKLEGNSQEHRHVGMMSIINRRPGNRDLKTLRNLLRRQNDSDTVTVTVAVQKKAARRRAGKKVKCFDKVYILKFP
jgi:D-lyxose ketol-isomerase